MGRRLDSLDTLKGLAILSVIYIHSKFFFSSLDVAEALNFVVANTTRFAVPAFFLTSGFLLSRKISGKKDFSFLSRQLEKVGVYYLLASAIYIIPTVAILHLNQYLSLGVVSNWLKPVNIGIQGLFNFLYLGKAIAPFLWFFTALFYSLIAVYLFNRKYDVKYLVIGSTVLHIVLILSNTYQILGGLPLPIEDALFFGLLFTSTGFWIESQEVKKWLDKRTLLGLTGIFFVLNLIERGLISMKVSPMDIYFWDSFFWGPYSFFTAPMTVFLFLYMLKRPKLGKDSRINLYGRYTLTGYILHPLVIGGLVGLSLLTEALLPVSIMGTLIWDLFMFPVACLLTMETAVRYQSDLDSFVEGMEASVSRATGSVESRLRG